MTALDAYLNAVNAGMDIVAAVQGLSDRELIARGASDIAARDLLRLCDTYFELAPESWTGLILGG